MDSSTMLTAQYLDEIISVLKKHHITSFETKDFKITLPAPELSSVVPVVTPDLTAAFEQRVKSMYGG